MIATQNFRFSMSGVCLPGEFPHALVVRIRCFHHCSWVQSLVWELRSHIKPQHAMAKKKKKKKYSKNQQHNKIFKNEKKSSKL